MKVAILGYGKMGKEIEKISLFRGHEVIYKIDKESQVENIYNADVAINFSTPETAVQNIETKDITHSGYRKPMVEGNFTCK